MYIVDRIEGEIVVCEKEDKSFIDLALDLFPEGVKAGDMVYQVNGQYVVAEKETKERSEKIRKMMDSLWED